MMPATPNLAMPLLFAAQAQKEITHNEAITLIDVLLCGCVEAVASDPAALVPQAGQAWIIGAPPVGLWSGRGGQLAVFTAGGWRFVPAVSGMRLFDRTSQVVRRCNGTSWPAPPPIADPTGGTTIDVEARSVLTALLATLRGSGLLNTT